MAQNFIITNYLIEWELSRYFKNFNISQFVTEEEDVTREEIQEEIDFIDSIVDTKVMEITIEFLVSKNLIQDDKNAFKRLLHRMWFALYPRSWRTKGSCAFEHVFLGRYTLLSVLKIKK